MLHNKLLIRFLGELFVLLVYGFLEKVLCSWLPRSHCSLTRVRGPPSEIVELTEASIMSPSPAAGAGFHRRWAMVIAPSTEHKLTKTGRKTTRLRSATCHLCLG